MNNNNYRKSNEGDSSPNRLGLINISNLRNNIIAKEKQQNKSIEIGSKQRYFLPKFLHQNI